MTNYLNIYIYFYVINLISLLYLLIKMFGNSLKILPLSHLLYYIIKYSKLKITFYALVIALTGLPPFLLFFAKFNLLTSVYGSIGFFYFYVAFLTICYKMFFYIQMIILKNIKFEIDIENVYNTNLSQFSFFFIHLNLFISIYSVFFFPDIFLISQLIC